MACRSRCRSSAGRGRTTSRWRPHGAWRRPLGLRPERRNRQAGGDAVQQAGQAELEVHVAAEAQARLEQAGELVVGRADDLLQVGAEAFAVLAVALVAAALLWPRPAPRTGTLPAPGAWVVAGFALASAGAWEFVDAPIPGLLNLLAHAAFAAAVVKVVVLLLAAPERRWDDRHRLALVAGPLLVFAVHGHWIVAALGQGAVDTAGHAALTGLTAAGLAVGVRAIARRTSERESAGQPAVGQVEAASP